MSDNRHILVVSGAPGVGKTVLMQRLAAQYQGWRLAGFVSGAVVDEGIRSGFYLQSLGGERHRVAQRGFLSPLSVGHYGVDVARLERCVAAWLPTDAPVDLTLIDEVGKLECTSPLFCTTVRRLLATPTPLVVTTPLRGRGLIAEIQEHPASLVVRINALNRDALYASIQGRVDEMLTQARGD
ncbi:MAG: Nucleoside-triphosphatase THEP1 [Halothiobacillaceae bacterium]|nr:MAG: Nucleoside-triphosphatase THEP1 [Halothiobacillaceae bacterium]